MNPLINLLVLLVLVVLALSVLWLRFQLWLRDRDTRILRQVTVMSQAPDPEGGCLGSLLPLILLGALGLLAFLARAL